jgi:Fe2+ transport system protein FeoA
MAPQGSLVVVVGVHGGPGFIRRVEEMGFSLGSELRVVKAGGPGPVVVELLRGGPRVALGLGAASRIIVEIVGGSGL